MTAEEVSCDLYDKYGKDFTWHMNSEVLNCLKNLENGALKNGEISINNAIREFCEDKLK